MSIQIYNDHKIFIIGGIKMLERKGIVTFKGNPVTLAGEEVKPGDKAPDFTAL